MPITNQTNKLHRYAFHSFMIFSIFIVAAFFSFYQGFVNKNYQKISFREWLNPSFWSTVGHQVQASTPQFQMCDEDMQSKLTSMITDSTQPEHMIYNDAKNFKVVCEDQCTIQLIQSTENKSAVPKGKLKIISFASNINTETKDSLLIRWADTQRGHLLYEITSENQAYFITFNPELLKNPKPNEETLESYLLHDIDLKPNTSQLIELLVIKQSNQGDAYLVASSKNRNELYLYSLNKKWLQKWNVPKDTIFNRNQINDNSGCLFLEENSSQKWLDLGSII